MITFAPGHHRPGFDGFRERQAWEWRDVLSSTVDRGRLASARVDGWIAVGMMLSEFDRGVPDSLAIVRASAYAHDQTLEDLASDIIAGRVSARDIEQLTFSCYIVPPRRRHRLICRGHGSCFLGLRPCVCLGLLHA